ncbi:ABC transporter permease [Martelella soudanensis]|uniref:ABC transporter permease n=1 Tax=unclassified Martelella TaxID=2629616 RepID=UPI0015DE0ABC|nr:MULTISPECIES: ABC transporter permease [unclassified Martelella]
MRLFHGTFAKLLIARFLQRILVFMALLVLMSLLPRLLPGDAMSLLLESPASFSLKQAEIRTLERQFGLYTSLPASVWGDITSILGGDLGVSRLYGRPVTEVIAASFPWTALLILGAIPLFLVTGVGLAIEGGRKPGSRPDRFLTVVMTVLAALPPFAAASVLVLFFAVAFPILPASGAGSLIPPDDAIQRGLDIARHAILPVIALALHEVTRYFFVLRADMQLLTRQPFVQSALIRGVSGLRERRDYYLRNLMAAIVARLGHSISTLFSAVLFVEVTFSYPGIGLVAYQAILDRDYVLLEGTVAVIAVIVLLLNWVLDVASFALARTVQ